MSQRYRSAAFLVALMFAFISQASVAAALQGKVMSGAQAIAGATVLVYAAGNNPGDAPQQVAASTSAADGSWSVNALSPTPLSGQIIYVAALGGHVGSQANNPSAALLTVAGLWAPPQFNTPVVINELSTVATTAQLQAYLSEVPCSSIAGNTAANGLNCPAMTRQAGQYAHLPTLANLVDLTTGSPARFLTQAPVSSALYSTLTSLNLQASAMAQCIRSVGQSCASYLSVASAWGGAAPSPIALAGSPFKTCSQSLPGDIVMSPDGHTAYVLDQTSNTNPSISIISHCSIDPVSGALTTKGKYTTIQGATQSMVGDPLGRGYLYVTIGNGTTTPAAVQTFHIDPVSGEVAAVGQPVATIAGPRALVVTPDGLHLYVGSMATTTINPGNGGMTQVYSKLAAFDINAQGGLTPNPAVMPQGPLMMYTLTIDPTGHYLYAVGSTSNSVASYAIGATGALSNIGYARTGNSPYALVTSPDGRHAYVSNQTDNTISIYNVSQGLLTPLQTSGAINPMPVGANYPVSMLMAPDGLSLYVISSEQSSRNNTGSLVAFGVDPVSGGLSPLLKKPLTAGDVMLGVTLSKDTRFAYASGRPDGLIYGWRTSAPAADTFGAALSLALHPIPGSAAALWGLLPAQAAYTPVPTAAPASLVIGGNPLAYLFSSDASSSTANTLDPVSGALNPVAGSTFAFGYTANYQSITPNGRFIYAYEWSSTSQKIHGYSVAPGTGALTAIGTWPLQVPATQYAGTPFASPDGKFLYMAVGTNSDDTLQVFTIDADTGVLSTQLTAFKAPITYNGAPLPNVNQDGRSFSANGAASLVFSPDGQPYCTSGFLTVACRTNADGTLQATTPTQTVGLAPVFSALGVFAYVKDTATGITNIYQERVGGTLTATNAPSIPATLPGKVSPYGSISYVEISPNGSFAYLIAQSGKLVAPYQVSSSNGGIINPSVPVSTSGAPQYLTVTADGRFGYLSYISTNHTITPYTIDPVTGALTALTLPTALSSGGPLLLTP